MPDIVRLKAKDEKGVLVELIGVRAQTDYEAMSVPELPSHIILIATKDEMAAQGIFGSAIFGPFSSENSAQRFCDKITTEVRRSVAEGLLWNFVHSEPLFHLPPKK